MASRIKAIGALRPRIDLGKTVQKAELTRYLAARTNLSEGQIDHVIEEMRDAIIFFNQSGRGVKVEGLGTYLPKINLNGRFSIEHRPDMDIKNALNTPDIFTGDVLNKDFIGLTPDQLLAIWNEKHPTDQVIP